MSLMEDQRYPEIFAGNKVNALFKFVVALFTLVSWSVGWFLINAFATNLPLARFYNLRFFFRNARITTNRRNSGKEMPSTAERDSHILLPEFLVVSSKKLLNSLRRQRLGRLYQKQEK